MKVDELFCLHQGNGFELYNMNWSADSDISFVSRTAQANGVVGVVDQVGGVTPFPAGYITVALGGSVLSSFVQKEPFYTAFHIMVLEPKRKMTLQEKLFYCMCIQSNAYRYSYGRQANRTLKDIELPDSIPDYVKKVGISPISTKIPPSITTFPGVDRWKEFRLSDLFLISTSKDPNLQNSSIGATPYISSTAENNGISGYVDEVPSQSGKVLTIARNGSVGSAFYQKDPFCASPDDVRILTPKFALTPYAALFIKTVIELEKFRYTYGRKLGTARLKAVVIKLPATKEGKLDIGYMASYIKSLPYSDRI